MAERFQIGIFGANADGGLALTTVPERWRAAWPDVLKLAQLADAGGIDFFLPLARWKGFGGETNARHHSFETLTFAAALATSTSAMRLFATVHTPFVHPVFAAKAMATIDHASGGRAGLNVVCGWNAPEFALFGAERQPDPYVQGAAWFEVYERLLAGEPAFDVDNAHYRLTGVEGAPVSLQRPRPPVMSAAHSPAGRAFAAAHADTIFTTFVTLEDAAQTVADIAARAQAAGRSVGVFTAAHVVCRPSQDEAEAAYERYAVTLADKGALDRHMSMKQATSGSHAPEAYASHAKRFAGGAGTYPLVGTPERIVAEMAAMREVGFGGVALSFVDYLGELPYFLETVLPGLERAGLRA